MPLTGSRPSFILKVKITEAVMDAITVSELVQSKRKEKGLTQEDLAALAHLDTRTIQRIEKGEVKPYFSTLKALSEALQFDFISELNSRPWDFSDDDVQLYREQFRKKKIVRIGLMIAALTVMLAVLLTFPSFRIFGLPKRAWAPFLYLFMFGVIIAIGFVWRCPVCGASLGSPFSTRLCSRCGFKFEGK